MAESRVALQSSDSKLGCVVSIAVAVIALLFALPSVWAKELVGVKSNISAPACIGDCDADARVTVDEIITQLHNLLLGSDASLCPPIPLDISGLLAAVDAAVVGCAPPIRYSLTELSTIVFIPTPGAVSTPEPLSGTFTVVEAQSLPPHTVIGLTVTAVNFETPSGLRIASGPPMPYGCSGELSIGCIQSVTFEFPNVFVFTVVLANGHVLQLTGRGIVGPPQALLPRFSILQLCGGPLNETCSFEAIRSGAAAGYALTLSAVPVE